MGLREKVPLVLGWLDTLQFLALIAAGLLLLVAGWNRDDFLGRILIVAGAGISIAGLGGQFLGWRP